MHLFTLVSRDPLKTAIFLYTWITSSILVLLTRFLLPHIPAYQPIRIRLSRAYLSSAALIFPDLVHRLPVGPLPKSQAYPIASASHGFEGYLIPGSKGSVIKELVSHSASQAKCVVLFAHGGGYARGEAKMYLNYMNRWEKVAKEAGVDLVFLSVEYPLTDSKSHPAQRDAFLGAYRFLIDLGVPSTSIVFMGDSAGGGICILSGIHCLTLGLPQPACSILHSPWIDPTMPAHKGGNALTETDYLVAADANCPGLWEKWLNGISPTSPDANPLFRKPSEIADLNPQLVLVGGGEFALQEGKEWGRLCEAAGVETSIVCERGQMHIYSLGSSWLSTEVRRRTDSAIFGWIQGHIRN
ncbi:Alpha/Beta hydrolase protein [Cadophora sp. MPI-SDFR-AT-0126]|nr:Alpha/Beta hydrolase protein [Leotiomycetes sp. MPI-SDFR-AT-0126]